MKKLIFIGLSQYSESYSNIIQNRTSLLNFQNWKLQAWRLDFFDHGWTPYASTFWWVLCFKKTTNTVPALEYRSFHKLNQSSDFESRFSLKVSYSSISLIFLSIECCFYFCWTLRSKTIIFRSCSGIPMDYRSQIVLVVSTCSFIQTHVFYPYLLHFSGKKSIESFFAWGGLFLSEYQNFFLFCLRIAILIDHQNWRSAISIEISCFFNLFLSKTTLLKFLSRYELTIIFFQMFIRWNNYWFCPYHWIIDTLNIQKSPIKIPILSISKLKTFWSYQLEFFRRGLYRDILLSKLGYFQMWFVVCSLDLLMRHIDGKLASDEKN